MRRFVQIKTQLKEIKKGREKVLMLSVYPTYLATAKDYMKKGGKFYAILDHETGLWSTDESDVMRFIDREVMNYIFEHYKQDQYGWYRDDQGTIVFPELLEDSASNRLKEYNTWFLNIPPNHNYVQLDTELTSLDEVVTPEMYRSKRLPYEIKKGSISAYEKLMSTLYSPEDRQKIEWSVGSVFTGASKKIEKILVIYGKPGSGKSTVLDLIKDLFEGYWVAFVASELVSNTNQFGTAAFATNPLVAIQDDGSLAKIDSPVINEIISHKDVVINEKRKQQYTIKSNAFLFLATNDTVDVKDRRMGITRRLLDVYPSGNRIADEEEFDSLVSRLKFEHGAIAAHCIEVFKKFGKNYYTNYIPERMLGMTNPIENFLYDRLEAVSAKEYWTRSELYSMYRNYCDEAGISYPPKMTIFGEQLKDYFKDYYKFKRINGAELRHAFTGLRYDVIIGQDEKDNISDSKIRTSWLTFDKTESLLDELYSDQPAQYPKEDGSPRNKWDKVKTKLKDIDKGKLYWVKFPEHVIKMDFDLKGPDGEKSLEENIKAANTFPPTYAELSKSGQGIHLYYIYDGDPNELEDVYSENIEIKKSMGNRAHRRLITKCNGHEVAHISSGLPKKKGDKQQVFDEKVVATESGLRTTIKKCIAKQVHDDTRSNIDFIYKILDDAYKSGLKYDVSDMRQDVLIFAINSTHQAEYCTNKVGEMKFCSEEGGSYDNRYDPDAPIIFFDYEVFPNLVLLCWKYEGEENKVFKVFNPTPEDINTFLGLNQKYRNKLIGFNNKEYDNHITYALLMGKPVYEVYTISQGLINGEKGAKFREAYNLSYSDILDFMPEKISLKKWEIRLGIHHQELGFKWDQPVPEKDWPTVASYCENDVIATEAVFKSKAGQAAWKGRCILCDLANILMGPGSTVNDSTNTLTTKLIVGNDKNPQRKFVYPDLAKEFPGYEFNIHGIDKNRYISEDVIITGKSIYKGYDPGEGGFVYAQHGMYGLTESDDSASHHPSSIIAENGFGPYTENFKRLLYLRLHVKHKEYDTIRNMFDGALAKYLESDDDAKALSFALKIAINSVYGLTAARFPHPLRDSRNVDNWVAKRGALFMIDLMLNVRSMGYEVIHCKTDSIKVLNPDDKVRNYICEFGKKYGYTFEVEHRFDRICLVNDAVYVCKYTDEPVNEDQAGKWDATGKQFQIPYVFKKLFSHEEIEFEDMCETKNVKTALYLDYNEDLPDGEHDYVFVGKTGQFCPIKPGCGGGLLMREKDGKYSAAESTKGYRWLESEVVKKLHKEACIDTSYYERLVDKAVETLNEFGNFEDFVSDRPYVSIPTDFMNIPETDEEEIPFN